jgi:DNA primase
MSDASGLVVGIRLRRPDGRKLSVRGGKEGLFIPADLPDGGRLLICEGPTDTAALLDLGFSAVGRPSCTGGTRHLVELVRLRRPSELVIVADGDGPGQRGAEGLAATLAAYCAVVRVITPPAPHKDARAWKQAGATAGDVVALIDAAPVRRLQIRTRKAGQCQTTV